MMFHQLLQPKDIFTGPLVRRKVVEMKALKNEAETADCRKENIKLNFHAMFGAYGIIPSFMVYDHNSRGQLFCNLPAKIND
jgi:hypothetical protein